jgi:hypothetical protein
MAKADLGVWLMRTTFCVRWIVATALIFLAATFAYQFMRATPTFGGKRGLVPKDGFVPNAVVALAIADAVLFPVYGKEQIMAERPFKAILGGNVWIVTGSIPCDNPPPGATCPGGAAEVRISKKTGAILFMTHYQ